MLRKYVQGPHFLQCSSQCGTSSAPQHYWTRFVLNFNVPCCTCETIPFRLNKYHRGAEKVALAIQGCFKDDCFKSSSAALQNYMFSRVSHVTLACHQRSASLFRRSWPYSSWRQDQLGWGAWAVSFRTIGCWKHTMVVLHQYDLHDFFFIHTYMHRKCGAAQVPLVLLILLQHWYLFSTFFLFQRYFPSTCYGNNSKFLDPSCSGLSLRIDDGLQPNVGTQEHPHQKFLHVMYDHYLPTAISNSSIYIKLNLTVPARCVIPSLPTFSQRCAASVQQLLTHDVRRRTLLGDTALALATWNTFSCMGLDIFHSTRVAHSDCDHLLVVSVKLVVDILDGCRIKMLIIDV